MVVSVPGAVIVVVAFVIVVVHGDVCLCLHSCTSIYDRRHS